MTAVPVRKDAPETRRYIGAGYYLLIGECVELGCDDWPDDEGVYLQFMSPADGHAMAEALARSPSKKIQQGAVALKRQKECRTDLP